MNNLIATDLLSKKFLLNKVYKTKNNISFEYTKSLWEVIEFFKKQTNQKVTKINSVIIFSTKSELIKEKFLSDNLGIVVKIIDSTDILRKAKNKLLEPKKSPKYQEEEIGVWDYLGYIANPIKFASEKVIELANNLYLRVSKSEIPKIITNKISDSSLIIKINYFSSNGEFIREFNTFSEFQTYLNAYRDNIDQSSYFEFNDNYGSCEFLTVEELNRISIFSNLKSKIEKALFG